jgi:ABC-type Fe3+-hydroxamate transport system substrate-binding protein
VTAIAVRDALGLTLALRAPARRVVSLVPSVTETLFAIGCGPLLAGCTRFCVHPAAGVASLEKVGGTKDPDVARIVALAPDLVLANQEENRREDVDALRRAVPVHVSYPRSLSSLRAYLADLGTMLGAAGPAGALVGDIERARLGFRPPAVRLRAIYLIWREPWMAAGRDTFIDAMLGECGFENAARPLEGRYPEVSLESFRGALDAVLLSSEPFPFAERHRAEVAERCGLPSRRVPLVSGEAFSWFGCRTREAFTEAARILEAIGP